MGDLMHGDVLDFDSNDFWFSLFDFILILKICIYYVDIYNMFKRTAFTVNPKTARSNPIHLEEFQAFEYMCKTNGILYRIYIYK